MGEAVALAALGRTAEASAASSAALARFPDISAEELVTRPNFAKGYGERAIAVLAGAGFPKCARIVDLPKLEPARRFTECEGERAKGER